MWAEKRRQQKKTKTATQFNWAANGWKATCCTHIKIEMNQNQITSWRNSFVFVFHFYFVNNCVLVILWELDESENQIINLIFFSLSRCIVCDSLLQNCLFVNFLRENEWKTQPTLITHVQSHKIWLSMLLFFFRQRHEKLWCTDGAIKKIFALKNCINLYFSLCLQFTFMFSVERICMKLQKKYIFVGKNKLCFIISVNGVENERKTEFHPKTTFVSTFFSFSHLNYFFFHFLYYFTLFQKTMKMMRMMWNTNDAKRECIFLKKKTEKKTHIKMIANSFE